MLLIGSLFTVTILTASLALAAGTYNRLVTLKEDATAGKKNIDVELDRRAKILDSLGTAAKRYLQHEHDTFKQVAEMRSGALKARQAGDDAEQARLESGISRMLPAIRVTMEANPELHGDATISRLMEEVTSTENRLGFAKSFYNGAARTFNETRKQFPTVFFVNTFFPTFRQDLAYWEVDEAVRTQLEATRLSM